MNLEQIKRLKLEDPIDLKIFLEEAERASDNILIQCGPATFADIWVDSIYAGNEEYSLKIWILTLEKLSIYFSEGVNIKEGNKKFLAYIEELKNILTNASIETLEYMKNMQKWYKLWFSQLTEVKKVHYYGMHLVLANYLNGTLDFFSNLSSFLEKENNKLKAKVAAYKTFIEKFLQD